METTMKCVVSYRGTNVSAQDIKFSLLVTLSPALFKERQLIQEFLIGGKNHVYPITSVKIIHLNAKFRSGYVKLLM